MLKAFQYLSCPETLISILEFNVELAGQNFFVWFGPRPAVVVFYPDTIKEIFSKNYTFQKPSSSLLGLLIQGLVAYEGDKWAKHRRLINPSFHLDKLKVAWFVFTTLGFVTLFTSIQYII